METTFQFCYNRSCKHVRTVRKILEITSLPHWTNPNLRNPETLSKAILNFFKPSYIEFVAGLKPTVPRTELYQITHISIVRFSWVF